MDRTMLVLIPMFFLTGCATMQTQSVLDSWIGKPQTHLIDTWGIPDKQMAFQGGTLLEYDKCGNGFSQYVGNGLSVNHGYCNIWRFQVNDQGQIVSDRVN